MRELGLAVGSMLLLACGASSDELRRRAAFDLECPEKQLAIVQLDAQTRGVSGCGRRATYVNRGTWLYNGP